MPPVVALVNATWRGGVPTVGEAPAVTTSVGYTVIDKAVEVAVRPTASVTVSCGAKVPAANAWVGLWLVELVPSPNVQAKVYGDVPAEAVPVKLTVSGPSPTVGLAVAVAAGAGFTVTVVVPVEVLPAASVTVTCTAYCAAALYV